MMKVPVIIVPLTIPLLEMLSLPSKISFFHNVKALMLYSDVYRKPEYLLLQSIIEHFPLVELYKFGTVKEM